MSNKLEDLFQILRASQDIWTLSLANAADLPNRATSRAETGKKSGNCVPLPFPKSYSGQVSAIDHLKQESQTFKVILSRFFMFLKLRALFDFFRTQTMTFHFLAICKLIILTFLLKVEQENLDATDEIRIISGPFYRSSQAMVWTGRSVG